MAGSLFSVHVVAVQSVGILRYISPEAPYKGFPHDILLLPLALGTPRQRLTSPNARRALGLG